MTIDQYSICPCGSGKKIKFCKCKDSIHEMERALSMISGGQLVAALDRLNQILDEHPNAAWCLAVKGRLLLELHEEQSLAENAERFIRLQPSNPLALTQQAAARGLQGDVQGATEALLMALAESSTGVDSFVLDVASVICLLCTQQGNLLTGRCFGGLALSATGYENTEIASTTLGEVNHSREISAMLKSVPTLDVVSENSSVRERYDEAAGLLKANQILLAESKFESILRQHPDDEAVLRGLLVCAVWRGDASVQSQILGKLSQIESIDIEKRVRDLAMSILVEPDQPRLSSPAFDLTWDVDDIELLEQEMLAHDRAVQLPADTIRSFTQAAELDVAPRSAFQLIDRVIEEGEPSDFHKIPTCLATAVLFGRQTDRPARVQLVSVCQRDRVETEEFVRQFPGIAADVQDESSSIPLMSAAAPKTTLLKFIKTQADYEKMHDQLFRRDFVDRLMETPLQAFAGKTAAETIDDESLAMTRSAIVRIVESYDLMSDYPEVLDTLHQRMRVEPLPSIEMKDAEQLYRLPVDALARVDVGSIDESLLFELFQRIMPFQMTRVLRQTANRIIELDLPQERLGEKLSAYMHLVNLTTDPHEAMRVLEEAKSWAAANEFTEAPLLLAEIPRRLAIRDTDGFQAAIKRLTSEYGDDARVMTHLQNTLVQMGLINPDGSPRYGAQPAAAGSDAAALSDPGPSEPGIWTPDAAPAQQASSDSGESKLWIPGSD